MKPKLFIRRIPAILIQRTPIMNKLLPFSGTTILLLFLIQTAVLASGSINAEESLRGTQNDPVRTERFSVDGPVNLEVATQGGWITIERGRSDQVTIEMFAERTFSIFGREQSLENQRIVIQHRNNSVKAIADARGQAASTVSFRVTVPEETSSRVTTRDGDINISNLKGNQRIEASGGTVDIRNTEGTTQAKIFGGSMNVAHLNGALHLDIYGGKFTGNHVNGEARLRSYGGQAQLMNLDGGLLVRSYGGNIVSHINKLGEGVRVESMGGTIDLLLDEDDEFVISAETRNVDLYRGLHIGDISGMMNAFQVDRRQLTGLAHEKDRVHISETLRKGDIPVILNNSTGDISVYLVNNR